MYLKKYFSPLFIIHCSGTHEQCMLNHTKNDVTLIENTTKFHIFHISDAIQKSLLTFTGLLLCLPFLRNFVSPMDFHADIHESFPMKYSYGQVINVTKIKNKS